MLNTTERRKPALVEVDAVAARLGVSAWTVRRMAKAGTLRGPKLAGPHARWRFDERDVEAAIEQMKTGSR